MSILFIIAFLPRPENPMDGIFITRRLMELGRKGIEYKAFCPVYHDSLPLKLAKRILGMPVSTNVGTEVVKVNGVEYWRLPVRKGIFSIIFRERLSKDLCRSLLKEIDVTEYDLVHAHGAFPGGYAATMIKGLFGIPCVITAHGSEIHTNPHKNRRVREFTKRGLEGSDRTVYVSEYLRGEAARIGVSTDGSKVIPNGVDLDIFKPLDKVACRDELGMDKEMVIGYIGGLKEIKGVDLLPEIFERIMSVREDVQFIVGGDGPLYGTIGDCAARPMMTGTVDPDRVPVVMSAIDLLIMPSRKEGFGLVALESVACGTPVISSCTGGLPDIVNDPDLLVEAGDYSAEAFAKKALDALARIEELHASISHKRIDGWEDVVEKEMAIYSELISRRI